MIKNIRHTGIVVSDMEQSIRFYKNLGEFEIIKDYVEKGEYINTLWNQKGISLRIVKMVAKDTSMIELLHFSSYIKLPFSSCFIVGCTHIAFTVDNVEREYVRLSTIGVKFNSPPCTSPDGYAKVVFCRDPDGIYIELVEVL